MKSKIHDLRISLNGKNTDTVIKKNNIRVDLFDRDGIHHFSLNASIEKGSENEMIINIHDSPSNENFKLEINQGNAGLLLNGCSLSVVCSKG